MGKGNLRTHRNPENTREKRHANAEERAKDRHAARVFAGQDGPQVPKDRVGPPGRSHHPFMGKREGVNTNEKRMLEDVVDQMRPSALRGLTYDRLLLVYRIVFSKRRRISNANSETGQVRHANQTPVNNSTVPRMPLPVAPMEVVDMVRLMPSIFEDPDYATDFVSFFRTNTRMYSTRILQLYDEAYYRSVNGDEAPKTSRKQDARIARVLAKMKITADPEIVSQLNGNNGEATNSDDVGTLDNPFGEDEPLLDREETKESEELYHDDPGILLISFDDDMLPRDGQVYSAKQRFAKKALRGKKVQEDAEVYIQYKEDVDLDAEIRALQDRLDGLDRAPEPPLPSAPPLPPLPPAPAAPSGPVFNPLRDNPYQHLADSDEEDEDVEDFVDVDDVFDEKVVSAHGYVCYKKRDVVIGEDGSVKEKIGPEEWFMMGIDGLYRKLDEGGGATGDPLPKNVQIIPPGRLLEGFKGEMGFYWRYDEEDSVISASRTKELKNIVTSAKDLEWFVGIRESACAVLHVATLGQVGPWDDLYDMRKRTYRSLIIHQPLLNELSKTKVTYALTATNTKFVVAQALLLFPTTPLNIVLDTCLYFSEFRTRHLSRVLATVKTCETFLERGRPSTRVAPLCDLSVNTELSGRSATLVPTGGYEFITQAEILGMNPRKVVQRLEYVPSSVVHGSADEPAYQPGSRFECVGTKGGAKWLDPYVRFPRKAVNTKCYQTACGFFANKSAVVNHTSELEVEKCLLRLSVEDPLASVLRANQHYFLSKLYPTSDDLTNYIRETYDPKYTPPDYEAPAYNRLVSEHYVDLIRTIDELQVLFAAPNAADDDFVAAMEEYIVKCGSKLEERRRIMQMAVDRPVHDPTRYNEIKAKPHEAQKYKMLNGKPELKFLRATVNLTGLSWVDANPLMAKWMKSLCEEVLEIQPVGLYQTSIKFGQIERVIDEACVRPMLFFAQLSDTTLSGVASAIQQLQDFVERCGEGAVAGVSHGDDMLLVENRFGKLHWIEGDISSCDGSHTDHAFHDAFRACAAQGYNAKEAFAQCGKVMLIRSPSDWRAHVKLRSRLGMQLPSGSTLTTFMNTRQSLRIMLSFGVHGGDLQSAAERIGYKVSIENEGSLTQVTFLSKGFYRDAEAVKCYTCLASILRNYGKIEGEYPGTKAESIRTKYERFTRSTIDGCVHEPTSALMTALRRTHDWNPISKALCVAKRAESSCLSYVKHNPCLARMLGYDVQSVNSSLTDVDVQIVERYYGPGSPEGLAQYADFVDLLYKEGSLFGKVVFHPFVDRIMGKRYGMAPCCSQG